jgi:GxxExxY protein
VKICVFCGKIFIMIKYPDQSYPLQDETKIIIGFAYEIHRRLGRGFLEIVYKDAIEYELKINHIIYDREKEYKIEYKDIILPHKFFADFIVFEDVVLEIKAKDGIAGEHIAQTINYLKASGCNVGLILNFGENNLRIKRVIR